LQAQAKANIQLFRKSFWHWRGHMVIFSVQTSLYFDLPVFGALAGSVFDSGLWRHFCCQLLSKRASAARVFWALLLNFVVGVGADWRSQVHFGLWCSRGLILSSLIYFYQLMLTWKYYAGEQS